MKNNFEIKKTDEKARLGEYTTAHGSFQTPNFMPVGTKASVKGIDTDSLEELGSQIMLVNTYHLWLRPGHKTISSLGGIHKFADWKGPILSDSGGFQVFSLKQIRELSEEGVKFKSHLDGTNKFLTPELAVEIQETLGVDIAMVLDECPPGDCSHDYAEKSLGLTYRWAKRCIEAKTRQNMSLFGITQGGIFPDLRKRAAAEIGELDFEGVAIGGLSVGEPKEQMYEVLSYHPQQLPNKKIRYLMGVGTPEDLVEAIRNGVDLFDCVMPTRSGRFGRAYISGQKPYINIKNAEHALSDLPLDEDCSCKACRKYSRAYINHMFKAREMLGPILMSIHNLHFYMNLMKAVREAIRLGKFEEFYKKEKVRWE